MANETKKRITHPQYQSMLPKWIKARDCEAGSDKIKMEKDKYLPPTSGMLSDGFSKSAPETLGSKVYNTYLTRAYFPDIFNEAVETAVGVMHSKPANIKLTPKLESLLTRASDGGETLQLLLRRINSEQLAVGRLFLMGDIRRNSDGSESPILLIYTEQSAYNWDDTKRSRSNSNLRFVALDESSDELGPDMSWDWQQKSRFLAMIDPSTGMLADYDGFGELPTTSVYGFREVNDDDADVADGGFVPVSVKGQTFNEIPGTFINSRDLLSKPDKPPLDGLADLILCIYRGEADYRQNLFMQGQDTLVTTGGQIDDDKPVRTGAGARMDLPINADAKYIGVNSQGLPEQRQALDADYKRSERKTSKLMSGTNTQESGDALRIRAASQTATLPQIAQSGAAGLQHVLRQLASMMGDNPEDIVVMPNMEFADQGGDAVDLKHIMESKLLGAPISVESIHGWAKRSGFTEQTWEDEQKLLEQDDDYDLSFSSGNEDEASANVGTNVDVDANAGTGNGTDD